MELQEQYKKLQAQGYGIAAISYDSQEILKGFADRKGITYPLLSDAGSKVIRSFGIFNESIPNDRGSYGVPHPGQYIVNPQGVVQAKYFEDAYAERVTASSMLTRFFNKSPDAVGQAETDELTMSWSISNQSARSGQHLTLILDVQLKDKMHVYAPGVEDFIPVAWTLSESNLYTGAAAEFPEPEVLELKAIGKKAPVYHQSFRIIQDITIAGNKTLTQGLGNLREQDRPLEIAGTFSYQACDDQVCFFPQKIPVSITVTIQSAESK